MTTAYWPEDLPLLPLRHMMLFPTMILPMFISDGMERAAVEQAQSLGNYLFLATCPATGSCLTSDEAVAEGTLGCVALILNSSPLGDGRLKILVQGIAKGRVRQVLRTAPSVLVRVEPLVEIEERPDAATLELMQRARAMGIKLFMLRGMNSADADAVVQGAGTPGRLADLLAFNLHLNPQQCCDLMALPDPVTRLHRVMALLDEELQKAEVKVEIESEAQNALVRRQRERYLREQLAAIRRELGEWDEEREIAQYRDKIEAAHMPPEAHREALRELDRLAMMQADAAEAAVVRTYLDWLLAMPWNRSTADRLDLKQAAAVLDADHHNMEKVKERILDFLGMCSLKGRVKGAILCLVGPPGVGKTSLGRSIAKAMDRRFVRISLGGIRDEAEIRGHRRTYLGALPGRIIQGLRTAGTNNPVFMLDEIDKIGTEARGDPAAALLEVLDPEQNSTFSDHYLNVPFDLSRVLFIATANSLERVPPALVDRMEVLYLSGYTEKEKMTIASDYLLPRQIQESGLEPHQLELSGPALMEIVRSYTRESGVRQLERTLATLCRKVARRLAEGGTPPFRITRPHLTQLLGPPQAKNPATAEPAVPGLAMALAWTPHGGEVLRVETAIMPGKGELILTGHLGQVMKESARAALTFIRTRHRALGLEPDFHEKTDIHIHVPAGAIPKDGPSAGMALCLSLVSALLQKPLPPAVAMTGEISLLGDVLAVGGFREKALAAARNNVKQVLIPRNNLSDVRELPSHIQRKVTFVAVDHLDQALKKAFPPEAH
ncbi:ATP-dependent Lon protease [Desulfacinum hydrothermale DSM 13146]|uniref:Lon protease n=1 Tax=Desulfacinum hydrothermale DSM 13146 TaxID=1121390 RepID=A0A1W1XC67_9BACT|nr:endopeptidase La [Desulfacinum hydrothermale]SMC21546.1 ATP-dependent Lon protease [Desulfacinum hydrothermale DSM 13146]